MGRFINADAFTSTGQGLLGNNMFAYCGNNGVNYIDFSGYMFVGILDRGGGSLGGGGGSSVAATVANETAAHIHGDNKENVGKRISQQIDYTIDYAEENWKDMVDTSITVVSFRSALVGFITNPKSARGVGSLIVAIWGMGRQFNWW